MLQNGVSHRCACVKQRTKGGVIAHSWGSANLPLKISRDMGYRSHSIAVSRDMGPLRSLTAKQLLHGAKGRKTANSHPESVLGGSSLGGPLGALVEWTS